MSNKYNKGEWSEFYVFLHALSTGKIHAGDSELQKIPQVYYNILAVIKNDIEYVRDKSNQKINFYYEGNVISLPVSEFVNLEKIVIEKIVNSKGTFSIEETESILSQLKIDTIKEKSTNKGDIQLQVYDEYTGGRPVLSFSIKSYLGSNPTLLNASNGTVLSYRVTPQLSDDEIESINDIDGSSKVKKRIEMIRELSSDLEYIDIPAEIFKENLQMVDYRMPEILSEIFLESYVVTGKKMRDVVNAYLQRHPEEKPGIIEYKVKEFLVAVALGMVPLTSWSGLDEATGGYIVVKENTEVICYHIYDRNRLKNYLYNYTKFDTPSMGRYGKHKAGYIQKVGNEQILNLVMQIRF